MSRHKPKKKLEERPVVDEIAPAPAAPAEPPAPDQAVGVPAEAAEATVEAPPAEDPLESLRAELAQVRSLADEYLDGWQRSRAEFLNYKKRVERDLETNQALAAAAIHTRYLPILDDLERALRDRPTAPDLRAWTEGLALIHQKLVGLLEAEGIEPIPAEGQRFDPVLHEAISFEDSDGHSEGEVIQVVQQGYRLGERVLRPARVRVAR